ncbi:MAG: transporter [Planctomycetota bacterium]
MNSRPIGMVLAAILLAFWWIAGTGAEAAEEGDKDFRVCTGKLNTPDACPVDPGHAEIEFAFGLDKVRREWDDDGKAHSRRPEHDRSLGLSVGMGLCENLDFCLGIPYLWLRDEGNDFDADDLMGPETGRGLGDLDLSLRYRFYENEDRHLYLAYKAGLIAPIGHDADESEIGTSQESWSLNQALIATKSWGRWAVNADIGYSLPFGGKRGDGRGVLSADLALGRQVFSWLQPEVELNYAHEFVGHESDADVLAATVGFLLPVNERFQVNLGVQQGLWGRNAERATTYLATIKLVF